MSCLFLFNSLNVNFTLSFLDLSGSVLFLVRVPNDKTHLPKTLPVHMNVHERETILVIVYGQCHS